MKAVHKEWIKELSLVFLAITCHTIAFRADSWGILVVGYLAALFALTRFGSVRRGFYYGMFVGMACSAIQLSFFMEIFSLGALALWAILGLWVGAFLAMARAARRKFPRFWKASVPFLWIGLEYTRSELYPLRFSWLTPGMALNHSDWIGLAGMGFYGVGFIVLVALSLVVIQIKWQLRVTGVLLVALAGFIVGMKQPAKATESTSPFVAGVQFEFANKNQVLKGLNRLLEKYPKTQIAVLSENSFTGTVPETVRNWCDANDVFLVAGGKEEFGEGPNDFRNTVFVIDDTGQIVHKQVKSVPIQFFQDGEPAKAQRVWHSPWGKIGIAICYDLSYSLVIDRFVSEGAQALIVPTMDVEDWGAYQHSLHAKIPYVRAREYGIPIFRVASSGISQLVTAEGQAVSSAPCPGPGKMLGGYMEMSNSGSIPLLRWIAKLSVAIVAGLLVAAAMEKEGGRCGKLQKGA
jgi:apolipoprotein N-acyltransferase